MKHFRKFYLSISIIFLLVTSFVLGACGNTKTEYNVGLYIKNYSNILSISNIKVPEGEDSLVSYNKNDTFAEVELEKSEDKNEAPKNFDELEDKHLSEFFDCEDFYILIYKYMVDSNRAYGPTNRLFAVNKSDGKVNEIDLEVIPSVWGFRILSPLHYFEDTKTLLFNVYTFPISGSSATLNIPYLLKYDNGEFEFSVHHKLSIGDFASEQDPHPNSGGSTAVDKFGNYYGYGDSSPVFVINKTGKFTRLNYNLIKSINGIFYTSDYSKYMNENGELVDNERNFIPPYSEMLNYASSKDNYYKVYKVENNTFYYCNGSGYAFGNDYFSRCNKIEKITYLPNDEYSVTRYSFPFSLVSILNNVYGVHNQKLYKINDEDGSYEEVEIDGLINLTPNIAPLRNTNMRTLAFETIKDSLVQKYLLDEKGNITKVDSFNFEVQNDIVPDKPEVEQQFNLYWKGIFNKK